MFWFDFLVEVGFLVDLGLEMTFLATLSVFLEELAGFFFFILFFVFFISNIK